MLGKRDPQRRLFATSTLLGDDQLDRMGFHGRLARESHRIFRDEDFSALYCADNGRPSVPPSVLALATLLQFHDNISDFEVTERCRYDLRWKAALHLDTHSIECPFAKSTFQAFRLRLTLHEKEGFLFEQSVKAAAKAGLLPRRMRVAVDSTPVRGRGAVKDTFNLLSEAIRKIVRRVAGALEKDATELADERGLGRHLTAASIKGSTFVDWQDKEDVDRFLASLLVDARRAIELASETNCAIEEVGLLRGVMDQDIDPEGPNGGPVIRRGVAKERSPSVSDPEMRHGRKSSGSTYNGHKAHLSVEVESRIITSVDVTAPSEPEGGKLGEMLDQTEQNTGSKVEVAYGDSAYGTARAVEQADDRDVKLTTKMPRHDRSRFGPGDFEVSEDGRHAVCPAGVSSARVQKLGQGHLLMWDAAACGRCPLRDRCTRAKKGRQLRVGPEFHDRRRREAYAWSEEGRADLRDRVIVEHAIGRMKARGARRARYFGRRKTRYQLLMTATVVNFSLLWGQKAAG